MKRLWSFLYLLFFLCCYSQSIPERRDSLSKLIKKESRRLEKLRLMTEKFSYLYFAQEDIDLIKEEKDVLLNYAKKNKSIPAELHTKVIYAYILISKSEFKEAEEIIDQVLINLKKQEYPELYIKANIVRLKSYIYQGKITDKELSKFNELKLISDELNNPYYEALVNEAYGYYYYAGRADYLVALDYYFRLIPWLNNNSDRDLDIFIYDTTVYNIIGGNALDLGNIELALEYLSKAIEKNRKTENFLGVAINLFNIGFANYNLKNYDNALKNYKEACNIAVNKDLKRVEHHVLNGMAEAYLAINKPDSAITCVKKGLKMGKAHAFQTAESYEIMAKAYLLNNNLEECEITLNTAKTLSEETDNAQLSYNLNVLLIQYHKTKGNSEKALQIALETEKSVEKFPLKEGKTELLQLVYELHLKSKNYEQAYVALEKYTSLSDSIRKSENVATLTTMNLNIEHSRILDSIQLVEKNKLLMQEEKLRSKKSLSRALFAGLLILLISCILVYYFYYQRKRLVDQLEEKQADLKSINKLNNKLLTVISKDIKSPLVSLRNVVDMIAKKDLSEQDSDVFLKETRSEIKDLESSLINIIKWGENQLNDYEPKIDEYNVAALIRYCLKTQVQEFRNKSIGISNFINADIDVLVDKDYFILALKNILNNAYKFTPENGKIEIIGTQYKNEFHLQVKDNGKGIKPELLNQLLLADEEKRTLGELSTGLGLSISKEMIEKNHGKFWIESEYGKSTTIHIQLPLADKVAS